MNNYEFYSNLQKYQENDIEHGIGSKIGSAVNSAYNWAKEKVTGKSDFQPTYYQKIDNAYGPGKARYFYTKEEWDAYQRELAGYRQKAEQDVAARNEQIRKQEQMQKQNYTNNRRAAEQAGAQRAFNESNRGKLYNQSQSSREAAMKAGQQTIRQQQKAEEVKSENYRKNFQAAQSMNNAEAQRAQKMKENAQNEVDAQKEAKRQYADEKLSNTGRASEEQKAKDRDQKAAQERENQKRYYENKYNDVKVEDVVNWCKSFSGGIPSAEEIAVKFDLESPEEAQLMLYSTTGIIAPVKGNINAYAKGKRSKW